MSRYVLLSYGHSVASGDSLMRMLAGMTGNDIDDIDACQIYDCFTYIVEVTLQDYGFFAPGEGGTWFSGGTISAKCKKLMALFSNCSISSSALAISPAREFPVA